MDKILTDNRHLHPSLPIQTLPHGMVHHCKVTPRIKFASTRLCTWVEGGTVKVRCLALGHNTMSPVRVGARTLRSGVERINHEATTQSSCKGHSVLKKLDCNNKLSLTFNSFRQFGKAMHCIFFSKEKLHYSHIVLFPR